MYRKAAWRKTVSDAVRSHQEQALRTDMQLLKTYGPTAFLLGENGVTLHFKVRLGDPHSCTCPVFNKKQELCKHICWVLLCKFSLPREHEYYGTVKVLSHPTFLHLTPGKQEIDALGLVERQILELLQGVHCFKAQWTDADPSTASGTRSQPGPSQEAGSVCRKVIQAQDVCPICQEELLEKKQPVSFCRFGCGNNVHISCIKVWANHQNLSDMQKMVKCPLCRNNFSSLKSLHVQVKNSLSLFTRAERQRPDRHLGVRCHSCQVCPVTGRCFKCTVCSNFYLCGKCVKRGCHSKHPLASRTRRTKPWLRVGEDASGEPKESNCHLDHDGIVAAAADPLSDSMLKGLPALRVRSRSRLLDEGRQCRLCLRGFSLGQLIRALPCFHKFHADCVDQILLASNSCPLDGYVMSATPRRVRDGTASPRLASCLSRNCADRHKGRTTLSVLSGCSLSRSDFK